MRRSKSKKLKTPNGGGSVVLRPDGRWMARYTTPDPETGLSVRKSLYAGTEQEARAKLIDALSARQNGTLTVRHGREADDPAMGRTLAREQERRDKTLHRYRELLELHALPTLGRVRLTALEPHHVEALMRQKRKDGLSATTVNHLRAVLRNLPQGCPQEPPGHPQRRPAVRPGEGINQRSRMAGHRAVSAIAGAGGNAPGRTLLDGRRASRPSAVGAGRAEVVGYRLVAGR